MVNNQISLVLPIILKAKVFMYSCLLNLVPLVTSLAQICRRARWRWRICADEVCVFIKRILTFINEQKI
jgi:hypothetical protein